MPVPGAVFVPLQSLGQSGRNRGREEVPVRDCTGEGVAEDVVLCLFLVQCLCASGPGFRVVEEACRVHVYKAIVDFVVHPPVFTARL